MLGGGVLFQAVPAGALAQCPYKQHCKNIAKLKVMHDEAACPDFKQEAETGRVEMCKPDNPVLGCPLIKNGHYRLPLGEMSGQFQTKAEASLSLMLRILLKMKDVKHTAWAIDTESGEEMCRVLIRTRANCVRNAERAVVYAIDTGSAEIDNLIRIIDQLLHKDKFKDQNKFKPWDTLKLLATFLRLICRWQPSPRC